MVFSLGTFNKKSTLDSFDMFDIQESFRYATQWRCHSALDVKELQFNNASASVGIDTLSAEGPRTPISGNAGQDTGRRLFGPSIAKFPPRGL